MYTLLRQCRLQWFGHMPYIADGRIPKDILYGELPSGKWPKGCPQLRYKDICKHIMKALDSNTEICEDTAANRISWLCLLKKQLKTGEERILNLAEERGASQSACTHKHPLPSPQPSTSALYAAGIATSALVLPATDHAVLTAGLQTLMAQYPWSTNNWRRPTTTSHNNK